MRQIDISCAIATAARLLIAFFAGAPTALAAGAATDGPITWVAAYTGEAAGNVSGGVRQGADYAGQLVLGADIDLGSAAALDGTTLHVDVVDRHGRNLSKDDLGGSTSVQETYGAENIRLANLTIAQSLLGGAVVLEVGRTVANASFLDSPLCQYFQTNSACGTPVFAPVSSGFTMWPVATWGGHAKIWFTPRVYVQGGGYEVNPRHGRNGDDGLNWSTAGATGVVAPYAIGYTTTFANDRLPRRYELGGFYDDVDYADPLRDARGNLAAVTDQPYATHHGRSGAFVRFEQMVYRPDSASERGLTLFGVAMAQASGQSVEDHFLEFGLVQRGVLPRRDKDTIGFVVNEQVYNENALKNLRLIRAAAGGVGKLARDQIMMELNYGAQVTPVIHLQPNLQYIIHPDQFGAPARSPATPNAFVLGLRFDVDLAALGRGSGRP